MVVFEYSAAPETRFAGRQMRTVTGVRAIRRQEVLRRAPAALLAGAWLALAPAAEAARAYVSNEDAGTVTVPSSSLEM